MIYQMLMWLNVLNTICLLNIFLDMAPEDEVINPSSLTKFRKLRLKDMNLLDMLIANFDRALTHPDEQDLQRLQEAVCAVQM